MISGATHISGATAANSRRGGASRPLAMLVLVLASAAALLLVASSPALAAAPGWALKSLRSPAPVPVTAPVNQVETVLIKGSLGNRPNDGKFALDFSNVLTQQAEETAALPYDASAVEVQEALATLEDRRSRNVQVTGGPKSTTEKEWSYTITFVNGLGGYELEEAIFGEEVPATEAEEKKLEKAGKEPEEGEVAEVAETTIGGRDTVEYTLTPVNTTATATSGTVTVTDTLPAHVSTKITPWGSGWKCTPAGPGATQFTCTSTTAVPAEGHGNSIFIEAYVDTKVVKPGDVLVNHAAVSGAELSAAEASDSALVTNTLTGAASAVTKGAATLNATVEPGGVAPGGCRFEYGTSTQYGSSAPCAPSPGSGSAPVAVAAAVSGLAPMTTYYYRVVAEDVAGTQYTSYGEAKSFTTLSVPTASTGAASNITQTTATLNGAVNPNGLQVTQCELEYGPTSSYGSSVACSPAPGSGEEAVSVSAPVTGLSAGNTYHFRVVATDANGTSYGPDVLFKALPAAPTVTTGSVSSLTRASANLAGSVDPNGALVEECSVEYGTSTAYGSAVACSPSPGSGVGVVAVSGAAAGLAANTAYHFRVVATNAVGTRYGSDEVFTTDPNPPTATTGAASNITQTTATLNGAVNPDGVQVTQCELEYGPTSSYGSSVACSPVPGSGSGAVPVSAQITGLSAGASYHYRVIAGNSYSSGAGDDQSFQTLPPATPPPSISQQAAAAGTSAVPDAELASGALTATPSGVVTAKVTCPASDSAGCVGTITLKTVAAVATGKAKAAVLTLAGGAFKLGGGQTVTVKLHLSVTARKLLARLHTLRVLAIVSAHDSSGATHTGRKTATLKLGRATRTKA